MFVKSILCSMQSDAFYFLKNIDHDLLINCLLLWKTLTLDRWVSVVCVPLLNLWKTQIVLEYSRNWFCVSLQQYKEEGLIDLCHIYEVFCTVLDVKKCSVFLSLGEINAIYFSSKMDPQDLGCLWKMASPLFQKADLGAGGSQIRGEPSRHVAPK